MTGATKTTTYPKDVYLPKYATQVVIRPMVRSDANALLQFFLGIPGEDRFYLKEDVTSPAVITRWADDLNYARVFPLLAFVEGAIVADATLHQRRAGARRHVGEIRVVVTPEHRSQGLGTLLVKELIEVARQRGMESLVFELAAEKQADAIQMAEELGFVTQAVLPHHVKDLQGMYHDLVIMELVLD